MPAAILSRSEGRIKKLHVAEQLKMGSGSGNILGALVQYAQVLFTENGAGTYTGTIELPAGSQILDVGIMNDVLWAAATSASMIVGDAVDPDGFFVATDLKATDLLVGEINNIEHPGGLAGAYIASEQRKLWQATARNVIGVITSVGAGTAGRTRMYVVYATPLSVEDATKS